MQNYKKEKQTILRVGQQAPLMDFLLAKMGGMSRNSVKSLLAHRQVSVNDSIQTRYDYLLQPGDNVTVNTGRGKRELLHPKLRVVYEDGELMVVEKKCGLLTVGTSLNARETTCFSVLKNYVREANPRAGIYVVHRLDRETSGLLVFAKSKELQEYMRDLWRDIVRERTYVALVEGRLVPPEGRIRTWLTENPKSLRVYSSPVDNGGKLSVTNYRTVKTNGQYSLLELHLETGRTNQIRVHMQSVGHPVVGDRKYGSGPSMLMDRMALHAQVLEFRHPRTNELMRFETPVPREFLKPFPKS
ncbi:MAG: RluA family pseudouridine synthase [Paludibacteraceae bacterium]|nr:RluA family pseudouridine synthase [Paludibacteraceae bacterium]